MIRNCLFNCLLLLLSIIIKHLICIDNFLDSAHALFVRATYLVCHRLNSSWKSDLNISLAALELLIGLARVHIKEAGNMLFFNFMFL